MPDEAIRGFSKRREAIELVKESRDAAGEAWSGKVAQWVASSTRPEKEYADADVLRERWRSDPRSRGLDVPGMVGRVSAHTEYSRAALFARLSAPDGLTADKETFGPGT